MHIVDSSDLFDFRSLRVDGQEAQQCCASCPSTRRLLKSNRSEESTMCNVHSIRSSSSRPARPFLSPHAVLLAHQREGF
ncbi:hypothetical protein [Achromobacter phage ewik_TL4]|nr:hypothetical protein [Achromobacter phage ewik_TL4]